MEILIEKDSKVLDFLKKRLLGRSFYAKMNLSEFLRSL